VHGKKDQEKFGNKKGGHISFIIFAKQLHRLLLKCKFSNFY